jgi:hypothetical protein
MKTIIIQKHKYTQIIDIDIENVNYTIFNIEQNVKSLYRKGFYRYFVAQFGKGGWNEVSYNLKK